MDTLIIGGTGSLGHALVENLPDKYGRAHIYSRDETKQWAMKHKFPSAGYWVGDMRDKERLKEVVAQVNPAYVIIAAALKQVDTCERFPKESLKTNALGVCNVVEAVEEAQPLCSMKCMQILLVSTDKACMPLNVYGMSKAISERFVTSRKHPWIQYKAVRYGNVLNSRGSIIPLLREQAEIADSFTLTDEEMTRYFMTLEDSVRLIDKTFTDGDNGDLWIPIIRAAYIRDLMQLYSNKYGKPVDITGIRPGEKLDECLVSEMESLRTIRSGEYHVIKPIDSVISTPSKETWSYTSSDDCMCVEDLQAFLEERGML